LVGWHIDTTQNELLTQKTAGNAYWLVESWWTPWIVPESTVD